MRGANEFVYHGNKKKWFFADSIQCKHYLQNRHNSVLWFCTDMSHKIKFSNAAFIIFNNQILIKEMYFQITVFIMKQQTFILCLFIGWQNIFSWLYTNVLIHRIDNFLMFWLHWLYQLKSALICSNKVKENTNWMNKLLA